MYTGGEPLVRKDDIIKLCEKHKDCAFHAFTNGTLIDEAFCKEMSRVGNISLSISLEGFEDVNDLRRGSGVFDKVMKAMDLLKASGQIFGTSICYKSKNIETVTSDDFLDMIIDKGCRFTWYFHYMPVGNEAAVELLPTKEQREYMYHRVREIRAMEGGKPIFAMDFQNDGEFVGGCIAGGRNYCHINANGDVEPCVFIHYSGANIKEVSLLDALKQPLFMAYRDNQPFNNNHLRPCPMLENPEILKRMVKETGAKSTDLQSPESVEHLCDKCHEYACEWAKTADDLWSKTSVREPSYVNYKNGKTKKVM
ncbi:radical SAM protein, partial [Anaerosporobacter sp.]|uniref:radical SAM protein n=1 Tax=Anaerosporobacter sp. TaxID=1872529 RepID=UPI00289F2F44